jgi:hypothetical protein
MPLTSHTLLAVAGSALIMSACAGDATGAKKVPIRSDFGLAFSPMYSAFDGVHDFRVPVMPAVEPSSDLVVDSWEVVDRDGVPQTDVADIVHDEPAGGATFRMRRTGDYVVVAHAGDMLGCSELHIAAGTPEQWSIGEDLYHNPLMLTGSLPGVKVPDNPSCDSCHGVGPNYLDVVHTPQQTAGFSDAWFAGLFTMGHRLRSNEPNPTVSLCAPHEWSILDGVPIGVLRQFHTWDVSQDEIAGLLLYLRSLAPMTQGLLDFGGVEPRQSDSAPLHPTK